MESLDRDFSLRIKKGDILLAGENFGCGSSREHAPVAIKACGIGAVVAASFARIFFRNAVNIGLPVIECKEAYLSLEDQDEVLIQLEQGFIKNITTGKEIKFEPYPSFIADIVEKGGLIPYVRTRLSWASK
jgi:3-isopropylmalate/(R)-2-methylmalate dehydratase small subunit